MQQWNLLTEKQKSYILALGLITTNFLVFLIPGLGGFSFEFRAISLWLTILTVVLYLLHIPLCLILRFKKKSWIVRGIFLYQFAGALAYVVFFVTYIASQGQSPVTQGALDVFRWWTLWYQPFAVTLSRFIGIPLKFTMGILYLIQIEISGYTVTSIRKDIRYERQLEEDRAHEEATKGLGGHW